LKTKQVIYALNSKNDESENLIANLKAQYDDERDQLIVDTNRKLEEFKAKLGNNSEQAKKIVTLEGTLKEYQKQR
jgi:ABC-type Fe3+-hydroxamate transport system substrate-binding protein